MIKYEGKKIEKKRKKRRNREIGMEMGIRVPSMKFGCQAIGNRMAEFPHNTLSIQV